MGLAVFILLIIVFAFKKENAMKSRIPFSLLMMLAAMVMSLIPAATINIQPAQALSTCDSAQFVADVTVPDGTLFVPGAAFTKTWRLKNIGSCTWSTAYAIVFYSGTKMGAPSVVNLPTSVAPGAMNCGSLPFPCYYRC